MAIRISAERRVHHRLAAEGVATLAPERDALRIGLLNLMPDRGLAEWQFAHVLARTGLAVELVLMSMEGAHGNLRDPEGEAGYRHWQAAVDDGLDGLIITGAPVERLPFEQVRYWQELVRLMDRVAAAATPGMYVCWAAQAALYHFRGIDKRPVDSKLFGIYRQQVLRPAHPLMTGLAPGFPVPVSRHTTHDAADLLAHGRLELLAAHPLTGPALVDDVAHSALYVFNHPEYDTAALDREYRRDLERGRPIAAPAGYYGGTSGGSIPNTWNGAARLLFRHWLRRIARTRRARGSVAARNPAEGSILQPDNTLDLRPWPLAAAS